MPSDPMALTVRQREVLDAVVDYLWEHGYAPSVRDLMQRMGYGSTSGVVHLLVSLEKKGYLHRDLNVARGMRVLRLPTDQEREGAA